jgi:hypothetical protein
VRILRKERKTVRPFRCIMTRRNTSARAASRREGADTGRLGRAVEPRSVGNETVFGEASQVEPRPSARTLHLEGDGKLFRR